LTEAEFYCIILFREGESDMKRVLPFKLTDYLFTYNYGVQYYGVLLNNPQGVKQLYNQYIIPYLYDDGSYQEMNYYFLNDDTPVELDPNHGLSPIFQEQVSLNKEELPSNEYKEMFIDRVKSAIDSNFYFVGWWDEYFIPGTVYYKNERFSHDYCIIGYDESHFYGAGYYSGYPKVIPITYNDFFEANMALPIDHAFLWKLNHDYIFNLDLPLIYRGLESYLSGLVPNTEKRDYSLHVFGKNVLIKLSEIIERDNRVDIRFVHTLKQHKLLMKERIEYIYNLYEIPKGTEIETLYSLDIKIQQVFNMCLKLRITRSNRTGMMIAQSLKEIVSEEERVYPVIMQKILSAKTM